MNVFVYAVDTNTEPAIQSRTTAGESDIAELHKLTEIQYEVDV